MCKRCRPALPCHNSRGGGGWDASGRRPCYHSHSILSNILQYHWLDIGLAESCSHRLLRLVESAVVVVTAEGLLAIFDPHQCWELQHWVRRRPFLGLIWCNCAAIHIFNLITLQSFCHPSNPAILAAPWCWINKFYCMDIASRIKSWKSVIVGCRINAATTSGVFDLEIEIKVYKKVKSSKSIGKCCGKRSHASILSTTTY